MSLINPLPAPLYPNPYYRPNDTAEGRLEKTFFIVEATSNEVHEFWRRHAKEHRGNLTQAFLDVVKLFDWLMKKPGPDIIVEHAREHAEERFAKLLKAIEYAGTFSSKTYTWNQISPGWSVQVGSLADMPVCVSVDFVEIDGFMVCFYDATSQVVDHRMVDKWFDKHFKGKWDGTRRAKCDSSNFHHCINAIEDAKKAKHDTGT